MPFFGEKDSKNKMHSLADVMRGIQYAICQSIEAVYSHRVSLIKKLIRDDGSPISQKVQIGERIVEIPILSMLPQSNLEMDNIDIHFKAKIGDVCFGVENEKEPISHSMLMLNMEGIKSSDNDVLDIKISFKAKDQAEGLARLVDELNRSI